MTQRFEARGVGAAASEIELRHFSVFQRVMTERSFSRAALELRTTRANVCRIVTRLAQSLGDPLFVADSAGELLPTPIAERLHHDLGRVERARRQLAEEVRRVHVTGRVLRLGASAGIFRTPLFRQVFRELHAIPGIRVMLTTLDPTDAPKAMAAGHCDLFVGCEGPSLQRLETVPIGSVPYHTLVQGEVGQDGPAYLVALNDCAPTSRLRRGWSLISEKRWLRLSASPHEFPPGAKLICPLTPIQQDQWKELPEARTLSVQLVAAASKQHPYEFLPSLLRRLEETSFVAHGA